MRGIIQQEVQRQGGRLLVRNPWVLAAVLFVVVIGTALLPVVALSTIFPTRSVWDLLPPEARISGEEGAAGPPPSYTPPEVLRYQDVDTEALLTWLIQRGSYLAEQRYIAGFVAAGQRYDIDPRLLVAITGAEQSFIPRRDPLAWKIATNPFNVFGCWCATNLTFERSAMIAAATVARLSQDMPPGADAIYWLSDSANPRGVYATGRNWAPNVSRFFAQLRREVHGPEIPTAR